MTRQELLDSLEDLGDRADSLAYAVSNHDDLVIAEALRGLGGQIRQVGAMLRESPSLVLDMHHMCDQTIAAQGEILGRAYLQLDRRLAAHMKYGHDEHCLDELCALRAELELIPGVANGVRE